MEQVDTKIGIPYSEIRDKLKTCDILFFRGDNRYSNMIAYVEKKIDGNGDFNHVGMCIRSESFNFVEKPEWFKEGKVYIFESTSSCSVGDTPNVENKKALCVQLRDLDDVVMTYDKMPNAHLGVSHLKNDYRSSDYDKPCELIQKEYDKYRGLYYDASVVDLMSTISPVARGIRDNWIYRNIRDLFGYFWYGVDRSKTTDNPEQLPKDNKISNWQFCSELVTNIYIDLGLFPSNVIASDVLPSDLLVCPECKHIPNIFEPIIRFHS